MRTSVAVVNVEGSEPGPAVWGSTEGGAKNSRTITVRPGLSDVELVKALAEVSDVKVVEFTYAMSHPRIPPLRSSY